MITIECECIAESPIWSTFNLRMLRSVPGKAPSVIYVEQRRFNGPANLLDVKIIISNFMHSFGDLITDRPAADDSVDAARYRWLKEKNEAALAHIAWRVPEACADEVNGKGGIDAIVDAARGARK
jgi:hypothetical protein